MAKLLTDNIHFNTLIQKLASETGKVEKRKGNRGPGNNIQIVILELLAALQVSLTNARRFFRAIHFLSHTPEQIHGNAKRPQGLTFTLGRDEAVNHARGLSTGSYNPEWFIRWLMRIYLIILNPILSDLHLSITLQELLFIKI